MPFTDTVIAGLSLPQRLRQVEAIVIHDAMASAGGRIAEATEPARQSAQDTFRQAGEARDQPI